MLSGLLSVQLTDILWWGLLPHAPDSLVTDKLLIWTARVPSLRNAQRAWGRYCCFTSRRPRASKVAEAIFSTSEKVSDFGYYSRTRDSIPKFYVGKQFRTTSRYRKPMSGNGFRYRNTVFAVGKRFPISGNSPDSRTTSRCRKTISDIRKRLTLSGNISIALNRSTQSK